MTTCASSGRYRWLVVALLFAATTINYADRQILGVLAAPIAEELRWSEAEYGFVVTAFQAAYAIGLVAFGRVIDLVGTRAGYVMAITIWSLAAVAHTLARAPLGFGVARFALGLGEAGNFPAAIKAIAEWFPKSERAFATGIFNSGTNVGAILTPLVVPWIAVTFGWRAAFFSVGLVGFLWIPLWLAVYRQPREHPRLSAGELRHIEQDGPPEPAVRIRWSSLLRHRVTWGLVAARFCTDPIWWFYLYWIPKFLHAEHGITLLDIGFPLVTIYLIADVGSIAGGWMSSELIRRGWGTNGARKVVMLLCALCTLPIMQASSVSSLWTAVALVSLAAAAHQGWAANIFTIVSDVYPRQAVSSMIGLSGFGGSIGGMLVAATTGLILERTGSYVPVFVIAGSAYLLALGLLHALAPTLRPVALDVSIARTSSSSR